MSFNSVKMNVWFIFVTSLTLTFYDAKQLSGRETGRGLTGIKVLHYWRGNRGIQIH